MAKLSLLGNAVVITSAMKLEDIRTIEKYNKDALILKEDVEGKKVPVFGVATGSTGEINQNGATFADATRDDDKFAQITLCTCAAGITGDVKEWLADKFGKAIVRLNQLEATIPGVLDDIAADRAAVMANITVVQ
jgi:hypothetical protein